MKGSLIAMLFVRHTVDIASRSCKAREVVIGLPEVPHRSYDDDGDDVRRALENQASLREGLILQIPSRLNTSPSHLPIAT